MYFGVYLILIFYVYGWFNFLYVPYKCTLHIYAWHSMRPEKGHRFPETRVIHSCDPLCGCWELNLNPL